MTEHRRRMDRVLQPEYSEHIADLSADKLREMRDECLEIETEVSYVRRLAQARIDILQAELDRRAAGGSVGDLIAALPQILAGDEARPAPVDSRLTPTLAPSMDIPWNRGMERLVSDSTLANLPLLGEEELRSTIEQLREFESEVSAARKGLHNVIDCIELDLAGRHKVGQV
jgi:hypothetical protein